VDRNSALAFEAFGQIAPRICPGRRPELVGSGRAASGGDSLLADVAV